MFKKTYSLMTGICALLVSGICASGAKADPAQGTFNFDPTGTGSFTVSGVDAWSINPGNVISVNGNSAVANKLNGSGSTGLTTLGLFSVSQLLDSGNNPVYSTGGGNKFLTFTFGYGETVTAASAVTGSSTIGFDPTNSTNFFHLYVSSTGPTPLTGAGFNSGVDILDGHIIGTLNTTSGTLTTGTTFGLTNPQPINPQALDQHNSNDYPGLFTVTGSGGSTLVVQVDSYNPLYIQPGAGLGQLTDLFFPTTSNNVPFTSVDPTNNFGTLGFGTSGAGVAGSLGTTNGSITFNGATFVPSGPDFQFSSSGSTSFYLTDRKSVV